MSGGSDELTVDRTSVVPQFIPLAERFTALFPSDGTERAQLCVYQDGRAVVDLSTEPDRGLQVIRSASKAVLALLAATLHDRQVIDLDAPIAQVWPEFGCRGKDSITTRTVLTHQAGLPVFDRQVIPSEALRWEVVTAQLASQSPRWEPGTRHGYHDLSFGWLIGEALRRTTGDSVGDLIQRELSTPLGLDLWVGTPMSELRRIRQIRRPAAVSGRANTSGAVDLAAEGLLAAEMMANPDLDPLENSIEYLMSEVPAGNAVTDARSLARLFAASIGPVDGIQLLSAEGLRDAIRPRSEGPDAVVGWDRRFASGFMLPEPTRPLGGVNTSSFGHYGRGVSMVFADPDTNVALAFLTSTETLFFGLDPITTELATIAMECAGG